METVGDGWAFGFTFAVASRDRRVGQSADPDTTHGASETDSPLVRLTADIEV